LNLKNSRALGIIFIGLAILFINIIPDPTDIITLQVYSAFTGADVSPANLSVVYLDFLGWSFIVGSILLLIGMWLMGWNFKRLWKKMDVGRYKIFIGLALLVVALVAFLDIQGMIYWSSFSSIEAYTLGQQGLPFWEFFKSIVFVLFLILPVTYFLTIKHDWSETFSIFSTEITAWYFGFADILYFVLQSKPIPNFLPWLDFHPIISNVSSLFGFSQVTNISLILTCIVGFLIIYLTNKVLKEKF